MDNSEALKKLLDLFMHVPSAAESYEVGRLRFDRYDDNAVAYAVNGSVVTRFFAAASVKDGRTVDTRTAAFAGARTEDGRLALEWHENGLILRQNFEACAGSDAFVTTAAVSDESGAVIESNYIAPLDFAYPNRDCRPLFLSLDQKMFLVPYDNDMWVRYESAPLRPGRTSYDLTAIYDEKTNEGLVIGAIDYDVWKNAIRCSRQDARCYTAFSGVADEGTHDICPHGYLEGQVIVSARFVCGWFDDIREGMRFFGEKSMEGKFAMKWPRPVPFGWNSYSAGCMTLEHWEEAGKFIREELPEFRDTDGCVYINLDANFTLDPVRMREIVDELHRNGMKAGNYMGPLTENEAMDALFPLKNSLGATRADIIMKDENGRLYPRIDGGKPVDITHPAAEEAVRLRIREIIDMGFDYIKIDFIAHGSVEGKRYDPTVCTGRQALKRFYEIVAEETDPKRIGRDVFVDLSIAPLFPGGYGHARRCCCDAFGHIDDVRYILNALNFGWWQSGTLYCYNDPDHTVLMRSAVDGRGFTDEAAARSRYNASVISGTVMLLSDNFGPVGLTGDDGEAVAKARERVPRIANNARLNALARVGKPFIPARIASDTTNIYFLHHEGHHYLALFNFDDEAATVAADTALVRMPASGRAVGISDNSVFDYTDTIGVKLGAHESVILEIFEA